LASDLRDKTTDMLELLTEVPFRKSNSFEKLRGDLDGCYLRRLNTEHRVVYEILPDESGDSKGMVHILRMKSHYRGILSLFFL
jgi:Txe/YoeB family toxin of toxin-antitoxin system